MNIGQNSSSNFSPIFGRPQKLPVDPDKLKELKPEQRTNQSTEIDPNTANERNYGRRFTDRAAFDRFVANASDGTVCSLWRPASDGISNQLIGIYVVRNRQAIPIG